MGHDISGFKPSDKETEIAYLRRGAFNPLNETIYNALNCHDCNGGVSGNGNEKYFSRLELMNAIKYIGENEELQPERKFLADCLANTEDDKIYIGFH